MIIGIDPGANGAIVYDFYGKVFTHKMPKTTKGIYDLLHALSAMADGHENIHCLIEKVGGYMPGNSGIAAVKFSRHCGHLEMALLALGIRTISVAPAVWMRKILGGNILYPVGLTSAKKKTYRKNIIKQAMQKEHHGIKVTLVLADALGILKYGQLTT